MPALGEVLKSETAVSGLELVAQDLEGAVRQPKPPGKKRRRRRRGALSIEEALAGGGEGLAKAKDALGHGSDARGGISSLRARLLGKPAVSVPHGPWTSDPYTKDGKVDLLPVAYLQRYQGNPTSGKRESVASIADDLRPGGSGLREPLILTHGTADGKLVLGEGNHRLEAAIAAGHTHVPVRMLRNRTNEHENAKPFKSLAKPGEYFPGDSRPSATIADFDEIGGIRHQPLAKAKDRLGHGSERRRFADEMEADLTHPRQHPVITHPGGGHGLAEIPPSPPDPHVQGTTYEGPAACLEGGPNGAACHLAREHGGDFHEGYTTAPGLPPVRWSRASIARAIGKALAVIGKVHDVSHQRRDENGRWTVMGGGLHRAAETLAEPHGMAAPRTGSCRTCGQEAEVCANCHGSGKKRDGAECRACHGSGRKAFCGTHTAGGVGSRAGTRKIKTVINEPSAPPPPPKAKAGKPELVGKLPPGYKFGPVRFSRMGGRVLSLNFRVDGSRKINSGSLSYDMPVSFGVYSATIDMATKTATVNVSERSDWYDFTADDPSVVFPPIVARIVAETRKNVPEIEKFVLRDDAKNAARKDGNRAAFEKLFDKEGRPNDMFPAKMLASRYTETDVAEKQLFSKIPVGMRQDAIDAVRRELQDAPPFMPKKLAMLTDNDVPGVRNSKHYLAWCLATGGGGAIIRVASSVKKWESTMRSMTEPHQYPSGKLCWTTTHQVPPEKRVDVVITHEMGHALEAALEHALYRGGPGVSDTDRARLDSAYTAFRNQRFDHLAPSEYSKKNSQEYFAECYAAYRHGLPLPDAARAFFEEIGAKAIAKLLREAALYTLPEDAVEPTSIYTCRVLDGPGGGRIVKAASIASAGRRALSALGIKPSTTGGVTRDGQQPFHGAFNRANGILAPKAPAATTAAAPAPGAPRPNEARLPADAATSHERVAAHAAAIGTHIAALKAAGPPKTAADHALVREHLEGIRQHAAGVVRHAKLGQAANAVASANVNETIAAERPESTGRPLDDLAAHASLIGEHAGFAAKATAGSPEPSWAQRTAASDHYAVAMASARHIAAQAVGHLKAYGSARKPPIAKAADVVGRHRPEAIGHALAVVSSESAADGTFRTKDGRVHSYTAIAREGGPGGYRGTHSAEGGATVRSTHPNAKDPRAAHAEFLRQEESEAKTPVAKALGVAIGAAVRNTLLPENAETLAKKKDRLGHGSEKRLFGGPHPFGRLTPLKAGAARSAASLRRAAAKPGASYHDAVKANADLAKSIADPAEAFTIKGQGYLIDCSPARVPSGYAARRLFDRVRRELRVPGMPRLSTIRIGGEVIVDEHGGPNPYRFPVGGLVAWAEEPALLIPESSLAVEGAPRNGGPAHAVAFLAETQDEYADLVVTHEMGHVWENGLVRIIPGFKASILNAMQNARHTGLPSAYAFHNEDEFFAECYTAWRSGRKDLLPPGMDGFMNDCKRRASKAKKTVKKAVTLNQDGPVSIDDFSRVDGGRTLPGRRGARK